MKKYIAEFIGTAALTLAVVGSIVTGGGFVTSLTAGITLGLIVLTMGMISGAHINPAVTIGAWTLRKIHWKEALFYILAQFAGAALALILVRINKVGLPAIDATFTWPALLAEFVGAVMFTFGIASIVLADAHHSSSASDLKAPIVIGGSLTLGVTIAIALGSNAVLNPAVAFGIGSLGLVYIIAPIIGSIAGMWLYKAIKA